MFCITDVSSRLLVSQGFN